VLLHRLPYQRCHPGGVDVNVDPFVRDAAEVIDGVGVPGREAGLDPPLVSPVDHRLTDSAVDQPAEARSAVAGEAQEGGGGTVRALAMLSL
jgi:hypothetical protein